MSGKKDLVIEITEQSTSIELTQFTARFDRTAELEAFPAKRRLDSLARLLEGGSSCASVVIVDGHFRIATNALYKSSGIRSFNYQLIQEIMRYFKIIASGTIISSDIRQEIFEKICEGAMSTAQIRTAVIKKNKHDIAVKIMQQRVSGNVLWDFLRENIEYGHAPGDIAIATAMGEVLWDDFLKLEQMLLTQTKLSPEEQQIKKAFKSYDDNQILKIGPKDMHAEIRIVDSLQSIIETNNPNKVKNNIYIGISKLCCLECNLMLDAINACSNINFETRGAHNVSHNEHWTPPLGIPISKLKFLRVSAALHQVILNPLQKAIINYANARWKKISELELKSGDRSEYAGRSVSPARFDIDKHIKDCRHVLDKNLVTAGCSDLNNLANQKL